MLKMKTLSAVRRLLSQCLIAWLCHVTKSILDIAFEWSIVIVPKGVGEEGNEEGEGKDVAHCNFGSAGDFSTSL